MAPNIGAGGSYPQATSDPVEDDEGKEEGRRKEEEWATCDDKVEEKTEARKLRWADCNDEEGKENLEEQETEGYKEKKGEREEEVKGEKEAGQEERQRMLQHTREMLAGMDTGLRFGSVTIKRTADVAATR